MTEAQATWLRKLRDEGDYRHRVMMNAEAWTAFHKGWIEKDAHGVCFVSPAGLAALAQFEKGDGG